MATKQELEDRIARLEQARYMETHKHVWRYSKHMTVYPKDAFNPGRALFWSWKCVDEKCDYGSGGTNHTGGLPEHFPADFR